MPNALSPRTLVVYTGAVLWGLIEFIALARARLAHRRGRQ